MLLKFGLFHLAELTTKPGRHSSSSQATFWIQCPLTPDGQAAANTKDQGCTSIQKQTCAVIKFLHFSPLPPSLVWRGGQGLPTAVVGKDEGAAAVQALHHPEHQGRTPALAHHGCGTVTVSSEWLPVRLPQSPGKASTGQGQEFWKTHRKRKHKKGNIPYSERKGTLEKNMEVTERWIPWAVRRENTREQEEACRKPTERVGFLYCI